MDKSYKISQLKQSQTALKGKIHPKTITIPGKTYYKTILGEDGKSIKEVSYSTPATTTILGIRNVKIGGLKSMQQELKLPPSKKLNKRMLFS